MPYIENPFDTLMPEHLVLVRHGESEPNVIHGFEKRNEGVQHPAHDLVYARPDWMQRLSPLGIEQAKVAGEWIIENVMPFVDFERIYCSTFLRANETALHLGAASAGMMLLDRIRERDWGEYGSTPLDERRLEFARAYKMHQEDEFYARLGGNESLAVLVDRLHAFFGTLHREVDKSALVIAHGEIMNTTRFVIERLLPEEFVAVLNDDSQKMRNCAVLEYMRKNPYNGETHHRNRFMRLSYPDAPEESPWGGQWREFEAKRIFYEVDVIDRLKQAPPLLDAANV